MKSLVSGTRLYGVFLRMLLRARLFFVDTYIVSYPKSGRTWVRFFVSVYLSLRYALPLRLDWYYFSLPRAIRRFHFTHLDFKAADAREVEKTIEGLRGKRVLFLIRDPRDCLVSFYFYRKHRQGYEGFQNFSIGEYIRDPEYGLKQVIDYMNVVYKHKEAYKDLMVVRYEDLRDPQKSTELFKEILIFLGQPDVAVDAFETALRKSEFSTMQNIEKSNEIDDERMQAKNIGDDNALTVRRGKVRGYKDYFSEDDCSYADREMQNLNSVFGYTR